MTEEQERFTEEVAAAPPGPSDIYETAEEEEPEAEDTEPAADDDEDEPEPEDEEG